MREREPWFDRARARFRLEHGLALGAVVTLTGLIAGAVIILSWIDNGAGALSEEKVALLAATLVIVGIQIFFTSFLLSVIGLRRTR